MRKVIRATAFLAFTILAAGCGTMKNGGGTTATAINACCELADGSCISVSNGADGQAVCKNRGGTHNPNKQCKQSCEATTEPHDDACCFFETTGRCTSVPKNEEGRRTCTANRGTYNPNAVCKSKCS